MTERKRYYGTGIYPWRFPVGRLGVIGIRFLTYLKPEAKAPYLRFLMDCGLSVVVDIPSNLHTTLYISQQMIATFEGYPVLEVLP